MKVGTKGVIEEDEIKDEEKYGYPPYPTGKIRQAVSKYVDPGATAAQWHYYCPETGEGWAEIRKGKKSNNSADYADELWKKTEEIFESAKGKRRGGIFGGFLSILSELEYNSGYHCFGRLLHLLGMHHLFLIASMIHTFQIGQRGLHPMRPG
jgi:hypothetical protein